MDIQVIPFDTLSYESLRSAFTVLRFDYDSAADIVYVELYDDGCCLEKPETVRRYAELQRRLQAITLGPVESRNFIVELAGQFAAKTSPISYHVFPGQGLVHLQLHHRRAGRLRRGQLLAGGSRRRT